MPRKRAWPSAGSIIRPSQNSAYMFSSRWKMLLGSCMNPLVTSLHT
jgi:hypothetical protein